MSTINFPNNPSVDDVFISVNGNALYLWDGVKWTTTTSSAGNTRTVLHFEAAQDQTTFTVTNGYTVGQVDVFLNGARLKTGTDFIATNGSTVVLTEAANSGDIVTIVRFAFFNVATDLDSAINVTYDNATSGLGSTNVQGAIDALASLDQFETQNWIVEQSGNDLVFKYNSAVVFKITSTGEIDTSL